MSTIIVTGLPRSGLTLTMQMLYAGGYPCVGEWPGFEKYRMVDVPWAECDGKAVKAIYEGDPLPSGEFDVIRLGRDMRQQAHSFNKFVKATLGLPGTPAARLIKSFKQSYRELDDWAGKQRRVMTLDFEILINNRFMAAGMLADFVGGLDVNKAASAVIDRSPKCSKELYELRMV